MKNVFDLAVFSSSWGGYIFGLTDQPATVELPDATGRTIPTTGLGETPTLWLKDEWGHYQQTNQETADTRTNELFFGINTPPEPDQVVEIVGVSNYGEYLGFGA